MYRLLDATGLRKRSRATRALFRFAYFRYKRHIEDPFCQLVCDHPEFFRDGHVIDVGANLGYTADVFSRATGSGWKVLAFEPEATNFASLVTAPSNVLPVQAAVGRTSGAARLWLSRSNPADHRIVTKRFSGVIRAEQTAPVDVVSIDDFLACGDVVEPGSRIAFCKIDVQGYELEVLKGMRRTIEANPHLVLAVEYCPRLLRKLGFGESAFFAELDHHGFTYFLPRKGQPLIELAPSGIRDIVKPDGYVDIICARRTAHPILKDECRGASCGSAIRDSDTIASIGNKYPYVGAPTRSNRL